MNETSVFIFMVMFIEDVLKTKLVHTTLKCP